MGAGGGIRNEIARAMVLKLTSSFEVVICATTSLYSVYLHTHGL